MTSLLMRGSDGFFIAKSPNFFVLQQSDFSSVKYNCSGLSIADTPPSPGNRGDTPAPRRNGMYAFVDSLGFSVKVRDGHQNTVFDAPCEPDAKISLSPTGRYLTVCETITKDCVDDNLRVYDVTEKIKSAQCVYSLVQRKEFNWAFQWSCDDTLAAILVKNELIFFKNGFKDPLTLSVFKIAQFQLHKSKPYFSILFSRVSTDSTLIRVMRYPDFGHVLETIEIAVTGNLNMIWNQDHGQLLVSMKDGVSMSMNSCCVEGSDTYSNYSINNRFQCLTWIPGLAQYVSVDDNAARLNVYDGASSSLQRHLQVDMNTRHAALCFNASGAALALGSLYINGGHVKVMTFKDGQIRCEFNVGNFSEMSFSPDSQYVLACCLSPSMKINNCFKIFDSMTGRSVHNYDFASKLLQCDWFTTKDISEDMFQKLAAKEGQKVFYVEAETAVVEQDEMLKKRKKLMKTLTQIEKLKLAQKKGETLQSNQISKINTESSIIDQLSKLSI